MESLKGLGKERERIGSREERRDRNIRVGKKNSPVGNLDFQDTFESSSAFSLCSRRESMSPCFVLDMQTGDHDGWRSRQFPIMTTTLVWKRK